MSLTHILIFALLAILVGQAAPSRWRNGLLLGSCVAAIYWMQPSTPIRNLDFWLPTASILATVLIWAVTRPAQTQAPGGAGWQNSLPAAALILGVILLVGLTRYLEPLCCLTPTRPPEIFRVVLVLGVGGVVVAIPVSLRAKKTILPGFAIFLLLAIFIILKSGPLARVASAVLRNLAGQSVELADPLDLRWLGFSYLAFRLLHVLRDYQTGRLPEYGLGDFVTYAIFFPAFSAGPIDRSQHYIGELQQSRKVLSDEITSGGGRILWGVFKKFVLADSLALFSLNAQNAVQVKPGVWAWVLLYAYAFRLYLDFSGYTDVALGLAQMMGIKLPENFDQPYLKQNLTAFWNSWHITLAQWFRAYFFNPLTRSLRSRPKKLPVWSIILVGQIGTMLLIGLWHGIAWNFVIWGGWHGLGLFVNNRWSDWARPRLANLGNKDGRQRLLQAGSWLLTFHFVTLGWVWFALPDPRLAWSVFQKLLGLG
jgi:alginate O-acetyltransferase complex protein AlgI